MPSAGEADPIIGLSQKRIILTALIAGSSGFHGEQYFAKRQSSTNAFNADLRCFSEEYCFGEIWARPGLERKFRSMLCIAMLVALNRGHELRLHVSGAINNGCTVEEIKEVLLQATVYCGLPSGVEGVRIAEEVLRERGIELGEAMIND